jgi:uncharacterized protein YndB with AHSA1/START domain
VSEARQQAFIEAPRRLVWQLVVDVDHHPDWWPGVVEVQCDEVAAECTYREVVRLPFGGTGERKFLIEDLDDPERFRINCVDTGAFCDITLTEARDGTFIEATAGMEAKQIGLRLFDTVAGQRYWRAWLERTVEAIRRVAEERTVGHTS